MRSRLPNDCAVCGSQVQRRARASSVLFYCVENRPAWGAKTQLALVGIGNLDLIDCVYRKSHLRPKAAGT